MFLNDAPDTQQTLDLYEESREDSGFVMNFLKVWAWRPDVYESFVDARTLVTSDTALSPGEIALVNAAAAAKRGDSYCSLAWGTKAAKAFSPEIAASVLSSDLPGELSERERALVEWTRAVVANPGGTSARDVEHLRSVGLDDRAIFEATFLAAARMAFCAINGALGASPDPQFAQKAPGAVVKAINFGRPVENGVARST